MMRYDTIRYDRRF